MEGKAIGRLAALLAACVLAFGLGGCDNGDAVHAPDDGGDGDVEEADGGDADGDADADADADADGDADVEEEDGETGDGDGGPDAPPAFRPSADRMMTDIRELTSDPYAGRLAGSAGGAMAQAFAETRLTSLDMDPAGVSGTFRQGFRYDQWLETVPAAMSIAGSALAEGTGFAVIYQSGSADASAEIVFAGYGMTVPPFDPATYPDCPFPATGYDDYAGIDATGAIVLVFRHGPGDDDTVPDVCPANAACAAAPCLWNFGYKAANARLHGAAALMVVQDVRDTAALPEGVTLDTDYYFSDFAAVFVDRDIVVRSLPDLVSWAGEIDGPMAPASRATGVLADIAVSTEVRNVAAANVLGVVPGVDPAHSDETVVLGAHLDHLGIETATGDIYRGADDNASGTAMVLEMAYGVREIGMEPARTLIFALFDAEEAGLVGSCFYVENPTYPIGNVAAMFSVDMVGAGDGSGLALYGTTTASLRWMADLMDATAAEAGLTATVERQVPIELSDHACFAYAGAPAIMATTRGTHTTYHTPADTADSLNVADLQAGADLLWSELVPLAMATEDSYLAKRSPATTVPAAAPRSFSRELRAIR